MWQNVAPAWRGRAALAATAALLVLILSGCGDGSSQANQGPDVVATTTQIGDWTRAVAGDAANVHQILQPNTDPHEYEPRPHDVEAVAGAEVVFVNGDGLDALDGQRHLQRGRLAEGGRSRDAACRCAGRARARGPRRRATTRTGGATRGTPRPP